MAIDPSSTRQDVERMKIELPSPTPKNLLLLVYCLGGSLCLTSTLPSRANTAILVHSKEGDVDCPGVRRVSKDRPRSSVRCSKSPDLAHVCGQFADARELVFGAEHLIGTDEGQTRFVSKGGRPPQGNARSCGVRTLSGKLCWVFPVFQAAGAA